MRSGRRFGAALACIAVTAAACADKPKSALPDVSAQDTVATTSTTRGTTASPLTGEQVPVAVASRPVVIVKVDNSPPARPQAGLNEADVIFEERVEGSVVRFLAVYQSNDVDVIGPVRSIRSTDAAIVAPLGGVFGFSGGITPFKNKVAATGVKLVEEGEKSSGVSQRAGRKRPYATYANTELLRAQANPVPPPALFPRLREAESFAAANDPTTVITGMRVVFGSLTTADWTWDPSGDAWLRSTNNTIHYLEGRERLTTKCVIVQTTRYAPTPYTDRSNAPVDEAITVGTGKAVVACDGQAVEATWSKPSLKAVTSYKHASTGAPIRIPTGRVWVAYMPTNGVLTLKSPVVPASTTTTLE